MNRRRGDNPWENRARLLIGTVLGLVAAASVLYGEHSDVLVVVLVFCAGAMLKVDMSWVTEIIPWAKKPEPPTEPTEP